MVQRTHITEQKARVEQFLKRAALAFKSYCGLQFPSLLVNMAEAYVYALDN
jgi:hypothetical protein